MKSAAFLTALGLAFSASWASAQTATERNITMSIDGEDDSEEDFFNIARCAAQAATDIEISVTDFPTTSQFWVFVTDDNTDCKLADSRDDEGGEPPCVELAEVSGGSFGNSIDFTLDKLTANIVDCDDSANIGDDYTIWVFGTEPSTSQNFTGEFGTATFKVDVAAPNAPTGLPLTRLGESFHLSWDDGNEGEVIDDFIVYEQTVGAVDQGTCACTGGSCLVTGMSAPMGTDSVATPDSTSVTINASSLGTDPPGDTMPLAVDEKTQLFVASVDEAGNPGVLSSAVCVTFVRSAGFCDVFEANGEDCPNGCSASPSATGRANFVWLGIALSLSAAFLFLGRRKKLA